MAQKTAWTGAVVTESDINTYLMGEGGAWTSYTPTLTQSATVTKTVTYAKYARLGRTIVGNISLSVTGSGTAANNVIIGLPVATQATVIGTIGTGSIFDSSAGTVYTGIIICQSTTTVAIYSGSSVLGSGGFTAGLASGDTVTMFFCYEAAS